MPVKERVVRGLEVLGYAVILTSIHILIVHFVFKISLFESYRHFYDRFFFFFNYYYKGLLYIYKKILGESLLNNPVFFGMFMRMFFALFVINLIYFAYRAWENKK